MHTCGVQVAYFMSWPTLGSAIILVMTPSEEKMKQVRVLHAMSFMLQAFAQDAANWLGVLTGAGAERDCG